MVHDRRPLRLTPAQYEIRMFILDILHKIIRFILSTLTKILAAGLLVGLISTGGSFPSVIVAGEIVDSFRSTCFCTMMHRSRLLSVSVALPRRESYNCNFCMNMLNFKKQHKPNLAALVLCINSRSSFTTVLKNTGMYHGYFGRSRHYIKKKTHLEALDLPSNTFVTCSWKLSNWNGVRKPSEPKWNAITGGTDC